MHGITALPSIHRQPPSTEYRAKPTNAAAVAPRYQAPETMPMLMARSLRGLNSAISEVAIG